MANFLAKNRCHLAMIAALAVGATANADMGRTPGQWGVSPSGAATYAVPIWTQPGPKGVQPSLAFTYSSQSGNGTMGVGWALSGFGSIERCPWTLEEDGRDQAVAMTPQDRFCLNGNKLRITSGPLSSYGTAGAVYQTQIANFSRITSVGTVAVPGTGPEHFIVEGKDGLIYEYGATADSKVIILGNAVYRWLLNKVRDRDGNSYSVTYTTDNSVGRVPLTVSWGPTAAGGSNYQYQAAFTYSLKSNEKDILYARQSGVALATKQRLDAVTIGYSASGSAPYGTRRQYALNYLPSPTTALTRLTEIKECATTTSICLKPTAIAYQDGTQGVTATPTIGVASPGGAALVGKYDFNGDGRSDVAYFNGSTWHVAFSNGSGLSAGINTGISGSTPPLAGRFLASQQDGFLANVSNTWTFVNFNGASFSSTPTNASATSGTTVTDYNGDGLQDLVWTTVASQPGSGWIGTVWLKVNESSGAASVPSFSATDYSPFVTGLGNQAGNLLILPVTRCPVQRECDVNGDGAADLSVLMVTTHTCGGVGGCTPTTRSYDLLTGPAGYFTANETLGTSPYLGMRFNDDRCIDPIQLGTTKIRVSGCGDGAAVTVDLPGQPRMVMDWDGDGNTDLLVNAGGLFGVFRSRGSIASPFEGGISTSIPYDANCNYFAADIEGDTLDEIVCVMTVAPYTIQYFTHNGGGSAGVPGASVFSTQVPDLLSSITDGYGIAVEPKYVSTAQSNYTWGTGTTLPLVDVREAMTVVGRLTISNGIGQTYDLDYFYKGARRHGRLGELAAPGSEGSNTANPTIAPPARAPNGKSAGFEEITVIDSRNGLKSKTTYEQLFPRVGMVKSSETRQSNDTLIASSTITNLVEALDSTTNNQRYFPYVYDVAADEYEVGGSMNGQLITSTVRTLGWNFQRGNLLTETTTVTDKDSVSLPSQLNKSWTTAITNSYEPELISSTAWCIGFVSQVQTVQTTSPITNTVTRTISFQPDSSFPDKCRVKVKTTEPASDKYRVVETYGFDAFGNVSTSEVVGRTPGSGSAYVAMDPRETNINWGTTGQFPRTVTDASGAVATFDYNYDVGTLFKVVDPNSIPGTNDIETTYLYDPFNRKTKETRPDGTYSTWTYSDCVTAGCASTHHRLTVTQGEYDNDNLPITDRAQYFDQLDRPIVSRSRLLNGPTWDGSYQWTQTQYDALGRVHLQFIPCSTTSVATSCSVHAVTNSYDLINRLTQESRPRTESDSNLQYTLYSYKGRTSSTTDAQQKVSTRVLGADSSVRQVIDANSYAINFAHDAAGSLIGVTDSQLAVRLSGVEVEYGVRPFTVASTDSALGSSTRTYTSLGELVAWSDASGQNFSATYDNVSRMRTRTEPGAYSTFDFGNSASNFNVGKLTAVSSTVGGQTYSEVYTYDNRTRLQGKAIAIPGDSTYNYGYTYDPDKGWLDTLTYPISTEGYSLALRYGYQNGMVQTVSDANAPATVYWRGDNSNAWGQLTKETLGNGVVSNRTYDAVTSWLSSIQSGTVSNPTSVQGQSYLYDLVGNVTQRQNNKLTLTETFHYGSPTDNLYRLEHSTVSNGSNSLTNLSLTYDLSGSILSKNEVDMPDRLVAQSICWTSYNYPSRIVVGNESTSFSYGPSRQRWRMSYASNVDPNAVDCTTPLNAMETTLYIGGLLEKVTSGASISYRHSIAGGDGSVVALYTRIGSAEELRYVLADNLGSAETFVEDGVGTVVNASFTAYGLRRDAQTWAGEPSNRAALDNISRQGFNFQTVLGAMGLNHMNGRVQDAVAGRFLSPDPYLTSPYYTQNYNRYAYVYNNAPTFTDPSGFDCESNSMMSSYLNTSRPGYQNGSSTAAGAAAGCEEIVVTGQRYDPGRMPPAPYQPPSGPVRPPDRPPSGPGATPGGSQQTDCKFDPDRAAAARTDRKAPGNIKAGRYPSKTELFSGAFFLGVQLENLAVADFTTRTVHTFTTASGVAGVRFSASVQYGGGVGNRNYLNFSPPTNPSSFGGAMGASLIFGIGGGFSRDGVPGVGASDNVTTTVGFGFDLGMSGSFGRTKYDGAWPIEALPKGLEDLAEFFNEAFERECARRN